MQIKNDPNSTTNCRLPDGHRYEDGRCIWCDAEEGQPTQNPTTAIELVMRRHPLGVTMRELVGALVDPQCTQSQAMRKVADALEQGEVILGADMRLYPPMG